MGVCRLLVVCQHLLVHIMCRQYCFKHLGLVRPPVLEFLVLLMDEDGVAVREVPHQLLRPSRFRNGLLELRLGPVLDYAAMPLAEPEEVVQQLADGGGVVGVGRHLYHDPSHRVFLKVRLVPVEYALQLFLRPRSGHRVHPPVDQRLVADDRDAAALRAQANSKNAHIPLPHRFWSVACC